MGDEDRREALVRSLLGQAAVVDSPVAADGKGAATAAGGNTAGQRAAGNGEQPLPEDLEKLWRQILEESGGDVSGLPTSESAAAAATAAAAAKQTVEVRPTPGLCLKTCTDKGDKVFINICKVDQIPAPPNVSDEELALAVAHIDNTKYRIPMGLSAPHAELDSAKRGCTAYDVAVNTEFFKQIQERDGMREFVVELCLSYVEARHDLRLARDHKILKKRTHWGTLQTQRIRANKKIHELSKPKVQEVHSDAPQPNFSILAEPPVGRPEFLVVEISLPAVKKASALTLDVAEDRFILQARPQVYFLKHRFAWPIDCDEAGAQFDRNTKVLTITCPVLPPE